MNLTHKSADDAGGNLQAQAQRIQAKRLAASAELLSHLNSEKAPTALVSKPKEDSSAAKIYRRVRSISWNTIWKAAILLILLFIAFTLWDIANPETPRYR